MKLSGFGLLSTLLASISTVMCAQNLYTCGPGGWVEGASECNVGCTTNDGSPTSEDSWIPGGDSNNNNNYSGVTMRSPGL
jgi:hypothetical protein